MLNRLLIATAAVSLLGAPPALADPGHGHDNGKHKGWSKGSSHGPPGHWAKGQRLPREYLGGGYYVDYRVYHLRAPPPGHRYVRVDGRVMLVAIATGLIVSVLLNS